MSVGGRPGDGAGTEAALARLRAVHHLTVALHGAGSVTDLAEEAVALVVAMLGVDRAALLLFDDDGVMRFKAWRGLSDGYRAAVEGHSPWAPDDAGATPIAVADVAADPALAGLLPVLAAEGIAACAFVPLVSGGRVAGKFMLYHDRPHHFGEEEVALAEIAAGHVALALDRRRREAALEEARADAERAATRLARLARVTAELSQAVSADDVAEVVLRTAVEELGGTSGSLCLVVGDQLEIAYAVGYPEDVIGHWRRFPLDADLPASEAARTGLPVFIRSPEELRARYPVFASTPVLGSDAVVVIPLGEATPIGALVVGFDGARTRTDHDEPFFFELAARCSVALERARLFDERERARARLALLAQVSAALGASLEYQPILDEVAGLLVPTLADGCAILLAADDGIEPVAVRHADERTAAALRSLCESFGAEIADVVRAGTPRWYDDVAAEVRVRGGDDTAVAAIGGAAVLPLLARRKVLGALAVVNGRGRPVDDDTVGLAAEVAARVAAAVDNGRLFQERTAIAHTLQANLLPPRLPDIPGIEVAARHVAAGSGVEVGGDFYDVFRIDARRFVVALGDVCGRGVGAATLAALCRHTIRSAVVTTLDPAAILAHVNQVLVATHVPDAYEPRFCTAVVAVLTRHDRGVTVELALGGHPPPLVRRAGGTVEPLGRPGFLLGVAAEGTAVGTRAELADDDVLVCVTDGVLERRRGVDAFGEGGLATVLAGAGGLRAGALVEAVEAAVMSFSADEVNDDLAVLAVRVTAMPPPLDLDRVAAPAAEASAVLAGEPASAGAARRFVAATLAGWGLAAVSETATLLTSELVTNAVLHAAGDVEVVVRRVGGRVRVEVHDGASELPVPARSTETSTTGRGLVLVEHLAADWGAGAAPQGKAVWFDLEEPSPADVAVAVATG